MPESVFVSKHVTNEGEYTSQYEQNSARTSKNLKNQGDIYSNEPNSVEVLSPVFVLQFTGV